MAEITQNNGISRISPEADAVDTALSEATLRKSEPPGAGDKSESIIQRPSPDHLAQLRATGLPVRYISMKTVLACSSDIGPDGELIPPESPTMTLDEFYDGLASEPDESREMQGFFQTHYMLSDVLHQIAQDLEHDLRDGGKFGIRGVTVSVGGELPLNSIGEPTGSKVLALEEVFRTGSELPEATETLFIVANYQSFYDASLLTSKASQWLCQGVNDVREALVDPGDATKVFPAIIVYNLDNFKKRVRFGAKLPEDAEARASLIKAIYVMDYIRTPEEVAIERAKPTRDTSLS